jgi:cytochrome c oxidase subunit II
VPSGSVIDLGVTSADVIHDFWIPGLAGKRDAMPNHINPIWFKADDVPDGQPKVFWGQCAEYCGTQHAYMKMRVVVASPADFASWSSQQVDVAVNTTPPAAFAARGCVGCHAIRGVQGAAGVTGPNLTHFGSRQTLAAGTLDNTPENLHSWLDAPNVVKRGNLMSAVIKDEGDGALTEQEITELVQYLESLNPGMSAKQ